LVCQQKMHFFYFCTGFRPTKGGRLIQLVRRGMHTGQALFPLRIEPDIPEVRPWKKLLTTGARVTWLKIHLFFKKQNYYLIYTIY